MSDLLGDIQLMFDPIQSVLPHVKAGKIQAIATSGAKRSAALPNVPTFAEIGVEVETTAWWGLFAPAQTPREVLARLNAEIIRAMRSADMQEKLSAVGIDPAGNKNILRDRVASYRHVLGPLRFTAHRELVWTFDASYSLFQTELEGASRLFSVGRYRVEATNRGRRGPADIRPSNRRHRPRPFATRDAYLNL